jgi:acetyl esterase/lipase
VAIRRYLDEVDAAREAEEFYAEFAKKAAAGPPLPTEAVALREMWPAMMAAGAGGKVYTAAGAKEVEIETGAGAVTVRIIDASEPAALYLHMHGGGWTVGTPDLDDVRTERLSRELGLTTVSVDYRLAPEHRFPLGLDDCEATARWLLENGKEQFGTDRLIIGGESAGANLALATALRLVKEPAGAGKIEALNLVFGNYDLTRTPSQERGSSVLSPAFLRWVYDQYLPPERRREPEASPLYDDLHGLPPALLTVGTADAMVDDSMFIYCRMLQAGVDCELSLLPGADHGFDATQLKVAELGNGQIVRFLRAALTGE